MTQLKRMFRPEFLNRVDSTIIFRALSKEQITEIVTLELNKVQKRIKDHNVALDVTDAAKTYLAEKGYNPEYGARPLRRLIQAEVEDVLGDKLLSLELVDNARIGIDVADAKLVFSVIASVESTASQAAGDPAESLPGGEAEGDTPPLEALPA